MAMVILFDDGRAHYAGLVKDGFTEAIGLMGGGGELIDITSGGGLSIVFYLHEEPGHQSRIQGGWWSVQPCCFITCIAKPKLL